MHVLLRDYDQAMLSTQVFIMFWNTIVLVVGYGGILLVNPPCGHDKYLAFNANYVMTLYDEALITTGHSIDDM